MNAGVTHNIIPRFTRFFCPGCGILTHQCSHARRLHHKQRHSCTRLILPGDAFYRRCLSTKVNVPPRQRIPQGTWDSHMHVVDPQNYHLSSKAAYKPAPHTLSQAFAFYRTVNIQNVVLVQPSIYGNDNSCLLDTLEELGAHRARGVVTFDPETINRETLHEWHELGVRGARVNLKSIGAKVSQEEFNALLRQYAGVIRPLSWVLQLYVSMDMLPMLETTAPNLNIKLCIDHFGHPDLPPAAERTHPANPYDLPGFESLISLLRQGNTWVKISAPYRIDDDQHMSGIEPMAKELLRVAPHRTVFATDWPHTRFEGVDIRPFIEACLRWCTHEEGLAERLFRRNAEELWDVEPA